MKRLSQSAGRARKRRARLGFESLDPRVLLDGAALLEDDPALPLDLSGDGPVAFGRPTVDEFQLDRDGWTQSAREAATAEASVNATLPFSDGFDGDGIYDLGPAWTIQEGLLRGNWGQMEVWWQNETALATLNGVNEANVSVSAYLGAASYHHAGLLARCSGPGVSNCYMGAIVRDPDGWFNAEIWRNVGGTWTRLASQSLNTMPGTLRFDVVGSSLSLYWKAGYVGADFQLQVSVRDTALTSGSVGIRGRNSNGVATFDNFTASVSTAAPVVENATLPFADSFARPDNPYLGPKWTEVQGNLNVWYSDAYAFGNVDSLATLNGVSAADVRLRLDNYSWVGHHVGLLARYSGPGDMNCYMGALVNYGGDLYADIWRNINGAWTRLASESTGDPASQWARSLRFDVVGSSLTLYYNDALVAHAQDTMLTAGGVGIRGLGGSAFGDFSADVLSAPAENAMLPSDDTFDRPDGPFLGNTWTERQGDFAVTSGRAMALGNVDSIVTLNGINEANVSIAADVDVVGKHHAGLLARYSGSGDKNLYMGALVNCGSEFRADIWRNLGGAWTQLASQTVEAGSGRLRFDAVGGMLTLYLDDSMVATALDNTLTSGTVGLRGHGDATFDNLAATVLTGPAVENATLPFSDAFDRPDDVFLGSKWTENSGKFVVRSGVAEAMGNFNSIATLNGVSISDVSLAAEVNVAQGHHAGLLARCSGGAASCYMGALINSGGGRFWADIWRNVGGNWVELAGQSVTASAGTLRFDLVGSSLKLYLDDVLVAAAKDNSLPAGTLGLRGRNGATFDDLAATALTGQTYAEAVLPFTDNFNRADATYLGPYWTEQQYDFLVSGSQARPADAAHDVDAIATVNGINQAHVSVSADVNVGSGHHAGLLARYSGLADKNCYMGALVNYGGEYHADIWRNVGGAWTQLASQLVGTGGGALRFDAIGSRLRLYLNGALVASAQDSALAGGTVGIRARNAVTFDNFAASAQAGPANVLFQMRNLDSYGEGFNDPIFGPARRAAFQSALGIWSSRLIAAYAGETIVVDAKMDSMGGSQTSAILGGSSPNYVWKITRGGVTSWYADALANHLSGYDRNTTADITITFNSDVDNSTVLGNTDWYYGLDGNCGSDIDFVSVVAHEIGHGLNFLDLVNQDGSWFSQNLPGVYDRFLEDAYGNDLVPMTQAQRARTIVSNELYWNGAQGAAGNGGLRPKMYAPKSYSGGSSVSHLDETVYKYELMSPYYSGPDHSPSAMELGMLREMGWEIVGIDGSQFGPEAAASLDAAVGTQCVSLAGRRNLSEYVLASPATDSRAARFVLDSGEPGQLARVASFDAGMEVARSHSLRGRLADEDALGLRRVAIGEPLRPAERTQDAPAVSHVARRHRVAQAIDRLADGDLVAPAVSLDESLLTDLARQWGPRDWQRG